MVVFYKEIRTRKSTDVPFGDHDPELYERYLNNRIKWEAVESKIIDVTFSDDELVETTTYKYSSIDEFRAIMEDRSCDPFLIDFLGRQRDYRKKNGVTKETILLDADLNVIESHLD